MTGSQDPAPASYPIDGVLDLHQFRPADAREVVGDYLDACRERGIRDVRIVHGKGRGVLRRIVHSALARREDVEGFRLATDGGGWGATIVRLRDRGRLVALTLLSIVSLAAPGCGRAADGGAASGAPRTSEVEAGGAEVPETNGSRSEAAGPEVVSLLGTPLFRPALPEDTRQRLEGNLAAARADYEADADGEAAIIWYGRRLAYLSRYRDAIEVYSRGLEQHPTSHKLLRHRGHRYISVRDFDAAIEDLSRAAELISGLEPEVEPDGVPNALNQPLSNSHFNIWYHLGLAHYLKGDLEAARDAYLECMKFSDNNDLLVATSDWLYMTYRRLGADESATSLLGPITPEMDIVENDAYHRRLLMYKGEIAPDELLDLRATADPDVALSIATQGYGVGNWYRVNGEPGRAAEIFGRILEGTSWSAFGYIAAEADIWHDAAR